MLDFAAASLSDQVKSRSGSAFGGFLAGEGVKNYDTLGREGEKNAKKWQVDVGNVISSVNDVAGFVVDRVMDQYCEQFTGPVTAHMHAIFADRGLTWWEYSFDVRGQLTLHYPKGASGGSVPLKGRIEGFATNYKVRENALTVKFPDLMTSTVQKRIYIMPMAPTDTQAGMFKKISSVEGSVFGNLVTPSNFLFEVHGTATARSARYRDWPREYRYRRQGPRHRAVFAGAVPVPGVHHLLATLQARPFRFRACGHDLSHFFDDPEQGDPWQAALREQEGQFRRDGRIHRRHRSMQPRLLRGKPNALFCPFRAVCFCLRCGRPRCAPKKHLRPSSSTRARYTRR